MTAPVDLDRLLTALELAPQRPSSDYDLNAAAAPPEGRVLRPAAVLIGVLGRELILTKRASHLKHHPGQIAFPGGKVDPTDADATATALREAQEEIGLDPASVTVLADLPTHEAVTGYLINPVLARIEHDFTPTADPAEVAEVFRVPLAHVLDPARYRIEKRRWRGVWRQYYVVPFGPYYIWGATARMLKALADRVTP
ncbi:MAG: CoA pyrophosphatase [Roseicyclus sp.]|uniref:CoA pyrophosphatase n=1 Tax=Roseicyclus sp. TaxID=1914329 RepID=UPI003A882973